MSRFLPLFERLLSLLVVFLLLSGTVIWTGRYLGHDFAGAPAATADDVQTCVAQPTADQLAMLQLTASQLAAADSAAWSVVNTAGEPAGYVVATEPYARDVKGYAGPTPLYIYIAADSTVRAITSADNSETADFYRRATEGIFPQIVGQKVSNLVCAQVDAVSRATFSSNAIIKSVKQTLTTRLQTHEDAESGAPVIGWGRTLLLVAVVLFGLYAALCVKARHPRSKQLRLVALVLNVVVTGFWCGQFLSLSLLRGWIQNGLDPLLYLPAIVLLLVAIVAPYFGRTHHYCQWVCPYGSLQELAWHVPVKKLQLPRGVYRAMKLVRYFLLLLLLVLLWFGVGVSLLDYEPFSAFLVTTAPVAVVILAAAFVVLGMFIPRPWCRCLCPVGALLELAEDAKREKK